MQVQVRDIKEEKEKVFHPFVLELKIESEQDLIDLWCRFDLSSKHINSAGGYYTGRKCESDNTEIWSLLRTLLDSKPYMK